MQDNGDTLKVRNCEGFVLTLYVVICKILFLYFTVKTVDKSICQNISESAESEFCYGALEIEKRKILQ